MSALSALQKFSGKKRATEQKAPLLRESVPAGAAQSQGSTKRTTSKIPKFINLVSDDEDDRAESAAKRNKRPTQASTSAHGNRVQRALPTLTPRVRLDRNEFLLSGSNHARPTNLTAPSPQPLGSARPPAESAPNFLARLATPSATTPTYQPPQQDTYEIVFFGSKARPEGRSTPGKAPVLVESDVSTEPTTGSSQTIGSERRPKHGSFQTQRNTAILPRNRQNEIKSNSNSKNPGVQQKKTISESADRLISQTSALESTGKRSLPFFWAYRDRFLPLLVDDDTFFTALHRQKPQNAVVPFKALTSQPNGLDVTLKDYQLNGLSVLVHHYQNGISGILADEMGLGKTVQILSLFQFLKVNDPHTIHIHLVVCPTSVLTTWHNEAKKFTPGLSVLRVRGSAANRKDQMTECRKQLRSTSPPDLILTTYPTFTNEKRFFTSIGRRLTYLVLDEGHAVKNDFSDITDRARRINAQLKLVVTGTPLQNNLVELWTILNVLMPKVFSRKTKSTFEEAFNLAHGNADAKFLDSVGRVLDVIMLRRDKNTPGIDLKLPAKNVVYLSVPLSPLQRQAYMTVLGSIASGEGGSAIAASVQQQGGKFLRNLLIKLRQVCSHPFLSQYETLGDTDLVEASSKFILLEKLLSEIVTKRGEKVIVFSEWLDVLDLVGSLISSEGIDGQRYKYLRLDGSTPAAKRNLVIDLFQKSDEFKFILVSITAGGQGITLTKASTVIILEDNWNPQLTLQAEARAHRLGQEQPVTIYKIYTSGTVEEQMLGRIQKKIYLAEKVTNSTSNILAGPSSDSNEPGSHDPDPDRKALGLSTHQLRNMIKRGTRLRGADKTTPEEMKNWTFEEMIEKCQHHDVNQAEDAVDEPLTEEEEQQWLSEMERVNCSSFEGKVIKRKTKWMVDHVDTNLDPRERRKDKERAIEVDGIWISKQSLRCKPGEAVPALIEEQSTKLDDNKKRRNSWTNETHCHNCKGSCEPLTKCYDCPRSFHSHCATNFPSKGLFRCPQHKCAECAKGIPDIGGMIYSCRRCDKAWCEDCLDIPSVDLIGDSLPELEELGFSNPRESFWYILCSECSTKEHLATKDADEMSSVLSTPPPTEKASPRTYQSSEFSTPGMDVSPDTPPTDASRLGNSIKRKFSTLGLDEDDEYGSDVFFEPRKKLFS